MGNYYWYKQAWGERVAKTEKCKSSPSETFQSFVFTGEGIIGPFLASDSSMRGGGHDLYFLKRG